MVSGGSLSEVEKCASRCRTFADGSGLFEMRKRSSCCWTFVPKMEKCAAPLTFAVGGGFRECKSRCWTHVVSSGGLPEADERASRRWTFALGGCSFCEMTTLLNPCGQRRRPP